MTDIEKLDRLQKILQTEVIASDQPLSPDSPWFDNIEILRQAVVILNKERCQKGNMIVRIKEILKS